MTRIAFIGGGNMASAIVGGLLRRGTPAADIAIVEPFEPQRAKLKEQFGIDAAAHPDAALDGAALLLPEELSCGPHGRERNSQE